ncbi:alpha/beta fold hydrolase [Luteimonas sp. SX5]|uniref:Alpha/beta fold hydrolase n=1 Tax=Luteimonas galliterrae TaxID=2940486 RepID=A0ABT0MF20_9GAMM|nr:alpha/beta fold hydrolase [Luteimonas galliterrae]MCL1633263.1 alpha/beta fold hydrolase [Luteimonas galliterrae]
MTIQARDIPVVAEDGHAYALLARIPEHARASLLWLPALGVAAKHYLPFAEALAARGIAVFLHEWRGNGSSALRADREHDWGYRELLLQDLPASEAAVAQSTTDATRLIGGHSLGGQLACCRLGLSPEIARGLWLVASGSPYWRSFPAPNRLWLPLAYRFLPWLAQMRGSLPGRLIGFGGNEARGVIRDWARTGLSGRYAGKGIDSDLEAAMSRLRLPVRALALAEDWLGPESSLHFLLSKLPLSTADVEILDAAQLRTKADHFAWMKRPEAIAAALATRLS